MATYLTDMEIAASLAAELTTTQRADNVLRALDLVDEQALLVLEVLVASRAVVVLRGLVPLHLILRVEPETAILVRARHAVTSWFCHVDIVAKSSA